MLVACIAPPPLDITILLCHLCNLIIYCHSAAQCTPATNAGYVLMHSGLQFSQAGGPAACR